MHLRLLWSLLSLRFLQDLRSYDAYRIYNPTGPLESRNSGPTALRNFGFPHLAKADYPKPTRFMGTLKDLKKLPHEGWPILGPKSVYQGPLPPWCGHIHKTKLLAKSRPAGGG